MNAKFKIYKRLAVATFIILSLAAYICGFVIVHQSGTLRKPAANMAYWYYSDNPVIENIEFYGFWPLRQIAYHIPGFMSRHNDERVVLPISTEM